MNRRNRFILKGALLIVGVLLIFFGITIEKFSPFFYIVGGILLGIMLMVSDKVDKEK